MQEQIMNEIRKVIAECQDLIENNEDKRRLKDTPLHNYRMQRKEQATSQKKIAQMRRKK